VTEMPPAKPVNVEEELKEWFVLKKQIQALGAKEVLLRQRIFDAAFPAPKEGTNKFALADGYQLTGQFKINRTIVDDLLKALSPELIGKGVPVDKLIKYAPDLVTKEYRELTEEQRMLFDQILIAKPGLPAMEVTKPKR
jgi:hypothetical protein